MTSGTIEKGKRVKYRLKLLMIRMGDPHSLTFPFFSFSFRVEIGPKRTFKGRYDWLLILNLITINFVKIIVLVRN